MSQPARAAFGCRLPAGRDVMRALPERETSGRMSGGAAKGTRRGGWGRWLAAAVLFLALALLALQAGAHARAAGHMVHGGPAVAAAPDQGCDHSRGAARCLQDDRDALGGAAVAQDDCCAQFCTITALLPEGAQADPLGVSFGSNLFLFKLISTLHDTPTPVASDASRYQCAPSLPFSRRTHSPLNTACKPTPSRA